MKDFLKEIPIFSVLSEEERTVLVDVIEEKKFPKDSIIVHKGQISDELYVIRSGEVKVVLTDKEGQEVILSVLKRGDFFGEMSLFDEEAQPRSASVIATRESHLLVISRKDFVGLTKKIPHVALEVLRGVIQKLRLTDEQIWKAKGRAQL